MTGIWKEAFLVQTGDIFNKTQPGDMGYSPLNPNECSRWVEGVVEFGTARAIALHNEAGVQAQGIS